MKYLTAKRPGRWRKSVSKQKTNEFYKKKLCHFIEAHSALNYLATVIGIITCADDVAGKVIKGAGKLNYKSLSG
jgi:hypothetical protein